jgi:hypothetical protein
VGSSSRLTRRGRLVLVTLPTLLLLILLISMWGWWAEDIRCWNLMREKDADPNAVAYYCGP